MNKSVSSYNLASKHRPRSFAALSGQRHVIAILRRAVSAKRVPQQLLFSGGSGLGKTTVARILAAAILCHSDLETRTLGEPCGICPSCAAVNMDRHPDLIEFDAASHGGKDEIIDLASRALVSPMLSTNRIYIIDEAHGLSTQGGQAFLKLLEEPPSHVIFMLCTTDPQKMLKTNRGRCTEFELLPPTREELITNLQNVCAKELWSSPKNVLEMVIDATDPDLGIRGTVNTLSKIGSLLANDSGSDTEQISLILGKAPVSIVDGLLLDCLNQDSLRANEKLILLRSTSSDEAIRSTIIDRSRLLYIKSLKEINEEALSGSLQLFESAVTMPKGSHWLDLFVHRAAKSKKSYQRTEEENIEERLPENIISEKNEIDRLDKKPIKGLDSTIRSSVTDTIDFEAQEYHFNESDFLNDTDFVYNQPDGETHSILHNDKQQTVEIFTMPKSITSQPSRPVPNNPVNKEYMSDINQSNIKKSKNLNSTKNVDANMQKNKHLQKEYNDSYTKNNDNINISNMKEIDNDGDTTAVSFIQAISIHKPDLAGSLRRCEITITNEVCITYPNKLHNDLFDNIRFLRQVAGRAGMGLRLQVSN